MISGFYKSGVIDMGIFKRNVTKLFGIGLAVALSVLTNPYAAKADGMPTMFDVYTEMDFNDYVQEARHSAYAIGENYLGWFAYDHDSTFDAKTTALKECNDRVDRDSEDGGTSPIPFRR